MEKLKNTEKCPKCGSTEILHAEKIPTAGGFFGTGHLGLKNTGIKMKGSFEAYFCKSCGFTEFYVSDLSEIK